MSPQQRAPPRARPAPPSKLTVEEAGSKTMMRRRRLFQGVCRSEIGDSPSRYFIARRTKRAQSHRSGDRPMRNETRRPFAISFQTAGARIERFRRSFRTEHWLASICLEGDYIDRGLLFSRRQISSSFGQRTIGRFDRHGSDVWSRGTDARSRAN